MTEFFIRIFPGLTTEPSFWGSMPGLVTLFVILFCSVYNVFSSTVDDDIFDRVYCSSNALACVSVLLHLHDGTPAHNAIATILIGLAARCAISVIQCRFRHARALTTR
ncbi:TPA: hypothetical protein LU109_003555 [Enterobacter hormaechei subsp. xiangfangensis]|nr:hypothetical protein [Enterobacter hormaechei subsp. xiangfangensis]